MGQMLQEIRELRKENSELRRQVEAARGATAAPTICCSYLATTAASKLLAAEVITSAHGQDADCH
jgi:cell division septum initiation protein DivIVA